MNRQLYEYSYEFKKQRKRRTLFFLIYIIVIYFLINIIFAFVLFPVKQTSSSMLPDFAENTFSFVTPIYRSPKRGDVVLLKTNVKKERKFFEKIWHNISLFFTACQYDSYEDKDFPGTNNQIRRIVGLPGDEIYMRDYVLYVKPAGEKHSLTEFELIDKTYNLNFLTPPAGWNGTAGVKGSFDSIILSSDEYFVLGDNRVVVSDSRLWGPVSKQDIKGRVILKYFPLNSIRLY